jgi:hypothetical protein
LNKAIKLKDNTYVDSTGVVHNRELLSSLLNSLINDVNKLKPTVLYANDYGEGDTVNLNDSVANYEYIEILYKDYDHFYHSVKLYHADNTDTVLISSYIDAVNFIIKVNKKSISGNRITNAICGEGFINNNNTSYNTIYTKMYITRVLGYK